MAGSAAIGAGVVLLAVAVAVIIVAVIFVVIGAVKLTRAFRARQPAQQQQRQQEHFDAQVLPDRAPPMAQGLLVARF